MILDTKYRIDKQNEIYTHIDEESVTLTGVRPCPLIPWKQLIAGCGQNRRYRQNLCGWCTRPDRTFTAGAPAKDVGESPFTFNTSMESAFDELRAETAARSADWVKATYDNQKASATFWTFGTVTGAPVLASALTDETFAKQSYTYQMVATGNPTSFAAFGLPNELTVNPANGQITGTLQEPRSSR